MEQLNTMLGDVARAYASVLKKDLGKSLVSVVLYGSVARGEATPYSDIDLLVVADDLPRGRIARLERIRGADQRIDARLNALRLRGIYSEVCPILSTPEEAAQIRPLYLDLVNDACILFDRGGFFAEILRRLNTRLKELGSVRRQMGRVRYWELKPDYRPGEIFEL